MAIRMSGMVSGLDTEGIIQSLMEVQTKKKTKVENNKTKLEWKQEKWNDLNNKIYKLYTGIKPDRALYPALLKKPGNDR